MICYLLQKKGGVEFMSKDEIKQLSEAFEKMRTNLRNLIGELVDKAEEVSNIAKQLSDISEQIAQGASDNANMAIQISENMNDVANKANEVKEQTDHTAKQADEGRHSMELINNQIQTMHQTTLQAVEKVHKFAETSKQIRSILDLITGIAEQTNLLALNAAIEAARAGEHGRGFAVVSDEIRKLAEQSASSAKQIGDLINNIVNDIDDIVGLMQVSVEEADKGLKITEQASKSFQIILDGVQEIDVKVDSMVEATEQVSEAVQNITAATEQQSAVLEETAGNVANLAEIADKLKEMSNRFKL